MGKGRLRTGPGFVHLSVRTCFSFLEGASRIQELCQAARSAGYDRFALTDRNGLYGLPEYLRACDHFDLVPVVGALVDEPGIDGRTPAEALVLPTSKSAYGKLCELISARHEQGSRFDLACALEGSDSDLVVISTSEGLLRRLLERRGGKSREKGLFVELRGGRSPAEEGLADKLQLPLLATAPVCFAEPEGYARHRVLRAIRLKRTLGRLEAGDTRSPSASLKSLSAITPLFWGATGVRAMEASVLLGERCRFGREKWGFGSLTFPRWTPPPGEEAHDSARVLREAAWAGLRRRYGLAPGAPLPGRAEQRLEVELDLVERKGFVDYFLIVRDLIEGFPRTCGRGSAAASLIAFSLGITHVDPVCHDLFFERFLNEGREHPPDIDIDFPWDERDEVLASAFARFGERIAMVANHVYFRPRAALREVARSYGLVEGEISALTKRIPYFGGGTLEENLASHPLLQGVELSPLWEQIVRLAGEISGLPRHVSVHPGGVVITPGPIRAICPVQVAPKGVPILQWEKEGVEEAGLVKIDLLGNRSLAVIRDALRAAREHGGEPPAYEDLAVSEDQRCIEMLAQGETVGCFYVESPAMRQLQRRSQRGDFEHLVIHSSIIRPAANAFIQEYLRRLRGGSWDPLDSRLERILQGTLGLTAYQEDLARLAIELAGFTPREGDQLRKVLARKEEDWRLIDVRRRFESGARERGLGAELIEEVWSMMKSFAGYSFSKAHSASYALVSFKCCYLRDRFPAEFLAAVISNGGGFYSTLGYVGEARRLGLGLEPACVNRSDWAWKGRAKELRVGLSQIRGLRREAGEALVRARQSGPFRSFADLVGRVPILLQRELTQLTRAGALDVLELEERGRRARLQWRIALLERRGAAGGLFASLEPACPEPPQVRDGEPDDELVQEVEAYGLPIRVHPLDLWSPELEQERVTLAAEVPLLVGKRIRICAWLVTAKLVQTKDRDPMQFILVEDRSGLVDVTVFPRVYAAAAVALHSTRPLLIRGRVEIEYGVTSLMAEEIRAWWGPCRIPLERFEAADQPEEDLVGD